MTPAPHRPYRRSVRRGHVPPMLRLLLREGLVYYLTRSPAARAAGFDPY